MCMHPDPIAGQDNPISKLNLRRYMILKRSPQGQGATLSELLKVRQGCTDAQILSEQPPSHPILIHIQSGQSMSGPVGF